MKNIRELIEGISADTGLRVELPTGIDGPEGTFRLNVSVRKAALANQRLKDEILDKMVAILAHPLVRGVDITTD